MGVFILLLLLLWPLAELIVAIEVAELIGIAPMLLLLAAGIPIGWWMMRAHGRGSLRRLSAAFRERRSPSRDLLDGGIGLLGGAFVIVPGFISDAIGIALYLPPTRALARRIVASRVSTRVVMGAADFTVARQRYDVDSTAHDVQPPQLPA